MNKNVFKAKGDQEGSSLKDDGGYGYKQMNAN